MNDFKMDFDDGCASFLPLAEAAGLANEPWAPVIITREQMDAEIARLAEGPAPANGRRSALIVHPKASPRAPGLAPGIQVVLTVLRPGERTAPFRHNATEVNICIQGSGVFLTQGREVRFNVFDVWNTPSYRPYVRVNDGEQLQVCLTYSNTPLLRAMQVYVAEDLASLLQGGEGPVEDAEAHDPRRMSPYGTFEIGDGAMLMPYERLINPPSVESRVLYWPWERVEAELLKLETLGADYVGRRLYLLYNSMTGRTNGTTPSFFATMTIRPAKIVDRPHRHTSAAINYYFRGSGRSTVAGRTYEWKAGDLMLSAPGWAVHNHASYDERVYELTVQDQPLNIAMESLLWQENLKAPPALLGAEAGFETNRAATGAS
jgi:gentisate 1,2-dioxygenase